MPLVNFGSILNFAEEIEKQDHEFYQSAAADAALAAYKDLFEKFSEDNEKNIQMIQRARRENVTEMILEGIKGFTRDPFVLPCQPVGKRTVGDLLDTARCHESRAIRFYGEAAEKLKAQPEVGRILKQLGKKHKAHLDRFDT